MPSLRVAERCAGMTENARLALTARLGQVYAAGSEDMDTLTFNAPTLYRHLTFSEAKKQPISEINLEKALQGLDMNMSQVPLPLIAHLLPLINAPFF